MAQKTGTRMVPTIFVVAALGIGAWMFAPKIFSPRDEPENAVTIIVTFDPASRSGKAAPGRQFPDYVTIEYKEAGKYYPTEKRTQSPWIRKAFPNKKMIVEVYASQVYGTQIGCVIRQHGNDMFPPVIVNGPGTARCQATVI